MSFVFCSSRYVEDKLQELFGADDAALVSDLPHPGNGVRVIVNRAPHPSPLPTFVARGDCVFPSNTPCIAGLIGANGDR